MPRKGLKAGLLHLAYTWDDLAGLVGVYKRVRDELDVRPRTCLRHGPTLSMYYADPDGNQLEFQIDLLEPDAANEFMRGPAFAANPIGVVFDPSREHTISAQTHHMRVDYSMFEGIKVKGMPDVVMSRGRVARALVD